MDRRFRQQTAELPQSSTPSESWLFAQAILGNAIASDDHLDAATRDRATLEWAAQISTVAESKLRALELQESMDLEVQMSQVAEFAASLREATWDPSKHPRRGGPPNAGWFAPAGSSEHAMNSGSPTPVSNATYSGAKRLVVVQAAWHPAVGHHWTPYSVVFDDDIRNSLSDDAITYAMGAYSTPTDPPHGNRAYGGVKHSRYNELVKRELKEFIASRKIKSMSAKQMEEFGGLINSG